MYIYKKKIENKIFIIYLLKINYNKSLIFFTNFFYILLN